MPFNKIAVILFLIFLALTNLVFSQQNQVNEDMVHKLADIDTTLWKYLSANDRSAWTISQEDSLKAIREYFMNGAKIFRQFMDEYNKIQKGRLALDEALPKLIQLLEDVKDYFEQAIKINPFDPNIRRGITAVYANLEGYYARKKDDVKQLQMIKNLLVLGPERLRRIDLLNRAGNIYFKYKLWNNAKINFQNAVAAIFEGEESEIDSSRLFNNIYLRGLSQLRLYEDEPALTSFRYARMIAPNDQFYNNLTGYIDFINWDGGNIRASEKYRDAQNLFRERKFDQAEQAYLNLIDMIKTEKAKNQAQRDLARIQFTYLNKRDQAIDRLWHVVVSHPLDSKTGIAIDSTMKNYWEIYSQMCLNLGIDYFNTNKKYSFAYLLKASQVESPVRGKAYLNLAMSSTGIPSICLGFCNQALKYRDQLNSEEQKLLYDTLYKAYSMQGNFDEALTWFKAYHGN